MTNLNPDLLDALRQAAKDAAGDNVENPQLPAHRFTADEWAAFKKGVTGGDL
ncbi:DUF397 domain-containing protein [Streptomyces sp. NBC_01483]|uniref:DUF397 domain-containing protein n=1 Tax=Streptomyces sp. NBC_01483 TaxID=2903883 RepID=UPI002E35E3DA|nr:DUF397 domain-containing protein [Streptomyces sp. NBC_01483]